MVIDTSGLIAILASEPERAAFIGALRDADRPIMSAASLVEVSIVVETRWGLEGLRDLDALIETSRIDVVPVDLEQARAARLGWSRYGQGRHRAGLNFGDCFSYALARVTAQPLLFKGDDFSRTDIVTATP